MANRFRVNTTEFSDGSTINSGQLIDSGQNVAIDWNNSLLVNGVGSTTIDWQKQILSGLWNASGLTVQGNSVITSNQTGIFVTTGQTGNFITNSQTGVLTGVFAPLFSSISKVSGNFSINPTGAIYLVNTLQLSSGTFPNASGMAGYYYIIKDWQGNAGNNNIVLTGTNGQTFDGASNFIINTTYGSYNFISDGRNWVLV